MNNNKNDFLTGWNEIILDAIMNNLHDHLYFKDRESRFIRLNRYMYEWIQLKSEDEAIGKTDFDFFTEKHAKKAFEDERHIINTGKSIINIEELETWPDGSETWVLSSKLPLYDDHGNIIGTFGISKDIDQHKKNEIELMHYRKHLEEIVSEKTKELDEVIQKRIIIEKSLLDIKDKLTVKNEEMGRFTYTVSHDLKGPLITIQTFLEFLSKDIEQLNKEKIEKDLFFIKNAANKMVTLLDNLLTISKIGNSVNKMEEYPLDEIVNETMTLLAGMISNQNVMIKVTDNPIYMTCDKQRMIEVFQNLIDNAIKFSVDGKAIEIHIGWDKDENDDIFIYVRDNGVGIEKKDQERIFELFEKLNTNTNGTGVGLSLVKRIFSLHGGNIWVESEGSNRGTSFMFKIKNIRQS